MAEGKGPGAAMWNERFREQHASYGTVANDFLRAVAGAVPNGPVLVLAAGEGRNAVFLAERGHEVHAMDQSEVAMRHAADLASARGVPLRTEVADLADFDLGEGRWAGIVGIWTHLPPPLRAQVFPRLVRALRPGGALVMELYAPAHLDAAGVGGPPALPMLVTPAMARELLPGLEMHLCQEAHRTIDEGRYHQGPSVTTQVLGYRPV